MSRNCPAYAHLASQPHALAVVIDDERLTWEQLFERTDGLQLAWTSAFSEDDRPMLVADRSMDFVLHFFACVRAGIAPILIAPAMPDEERQRIQRLTCANRIVDRQVRLELAATGPPDDLQAPTAVTWDAERTLFVVMTSGTTGDPRPISILCEQVIFSTLGSAARLGALPHDRWYAPLPLHHVGGIMVFLRALILGFTAVYSHSFDPVLAAQQLSNGTITLASFVPVMLERILAVEPDLKLPSTLRAILIGGAACSPQLIESAKGLQLPIARSWGMSESASQIATAPPGQWDAALSPLPFADVSQENGILWIRGPQVQQGELQTSDRGRVDNHRVIIEGRADDVFISGGENIDPVEIESVLQSDPRVSHALVTGVPSRTWGHRIVAFVVPKDPTAVEASALQQLCAQKLEAFKVPKILHIVQDIPRNSLGKPSRAQAQRLHVELTQNSKNPNHHVISSATGARS